MKLSTKLDKAPDNRKDRIKQNFFIRHRVFFLTASTLLLLGTTAATATTFVVAKKYSPDSSMLKIKNMNKDIVQSLTIKDNNGKDLVANNVVMKYKQAKIGQGQNISDLYLKTIVDTEDNTFYTRKTAGYSIKGTLSAALSQVKSKITGNANVGRGGSTIDQQLAKIIVFGEGNANSVGDKIIQIIDARKLAKNYTRNEILSSYINQLHLTPSTVGVKAASMKLFGNDLTNSDKNNPKDVAQVAFLSGLGQAPSTYINDFDKLGKARTKIVLGIMLENNLINKNQYKDSLKFVNSEDFKINKSSSSGIDPQYQSYISKVKSEISDMHLPSNSNIEVKTFATKEKLDELNKIVNNQGEHDSSIPYNTIEHPDTLAAISAIDTKTGHIIGLATNSNNPETPYVGNRSSGSGIKPLLDYAPALEYGKLQPNSIMNGNSFTTQGWNVQNYGNAQYGKIDASKALGASLNTSAVQAFEMTNQQQKDSIMSPLGLSEYNSGDSFNVVRSIDYPTNTLAMASAYSAIGNDGVRVEPTTIDTVKVNGKELKLKQKESKRSMSSNTAKNLVSMLQNVVEEGGSEPYAGPQYTGLQKGSYAVKSGLSNYASSVQDGSGKSPDAWMNMTSGDISVSTWLGSPSYNDAKYGITAYPSSMENNGRVYLLNNAIKTLKTTDNPQFNWTGTVMNNSQTVKEIPVINQVDKSDVKKFGPKIPQVSKQTQEQEKQTQDQVNSTQQRIDQTLNN